MYVNEWITYKVQENNTWKFESFTITNDKNFKKKKEDTYRDILNEDKNLKRKLLIESLLGLRQKKKKIETQEGTFI